MQLSFYLPLKVLFRKSASIAALTAELIPKRGCCTVKGRGRRVPVQHQKLKEVYSNGKLI